MIDQQINMYHVEFRPESNAFQSAFMLKAVLILAVALTFIYAFARQGVAGIHSELEIVARVGLIQLQ